MKCLGLHTDEHKTWLAMDEPKECPYCHVMAYHWVARPGQSATCLGCDTTRYPYAPR